MTFLSLVIGCRFVRAPRIPVHPSKPLQPKAGLVDCS